MFLLYRDKEPAGYFFSLKNLDICFFGWLTRLFGDRGFVCVCAGAVESIFGIQTLIWRKIGLVDDEFCCTMLRFKML